MTAPTFHVSPTLDSCTGRDDLFRRSRISVSSSVILSIFQYHSQKDRMTRNKTRSRHAARTSIGMAQGLRYERMLHPGYAPVSEQGASVLDIVVLHMKGMQQPMHQGGEQDAHDSNEDQPTKERID